MSDGLIKNNNEVTDLYYYKEELKFIQRINALLRPDLSKTINKELIYINNHKQQER
jgi:hypothetical protein